MALSGQKVVEVAGAAVPLGSQLVRGPLAIKALSTNTDLIYVGNNGSGDVSSANGYHLSANEEVVFKSVNNLGLIFVDAVVGGEGVAWIDLGF